MAFPLPNHPSHLLHLPLCHLPLLYMSPYYHYHYSPIYASTTELNHQDHCSRFRFLFCSAFCATPFEICSNSKRFWDIERFGLFALCRFALFLFAFQYFKIAAFVYSRFCLWLWLFLHCSVELYDGVFYSINFFIYWECLSGFLVYLSRGEEKSDFMNSMVLFW